MNRRIDDDKGHTYELSQSAVKCMRGILSCWLRQADRVCSTFTLSVIWFAVGILLHFMIKPQ